MLMLVYVIHQGVELQTPPSRGSFASRQRNIKKQNKGSYIYGEAWTLRQTLGC